MKFQFYYNNEDNEVCFNMPELDVEFSNNQELSNLIMGLMPSMDSNMPTDEWLCIAHAYVAAFNECCVVIVEEF